MRRGLAASREQAQAAIAAGAVLVAGAVAAKPAHLVAPDQPIVVVGPPPAFVSRGGQKLAAALDRFPVTVAGRRCLDAGASTGGFTDCLLQRGAASVAAVDVGYGQLDRRLRADPRVTVLDRTNVRHFRSATPFELVVADLSFISLRTVAPALVGPSLAEGGDAVVLVKPQFEAGRVEASRGRGVIRDPAVWAAALLEVRSALAAAGASMMDVMVSPVRGADGNVEFLAHAQHRSATPAVSERRVDEVVAEAADRERG